jgi:hypothetical protein
MDKGATKQCLIDTDAEKTRLRPFIYSKPSQDSTFRSYLENRVDTVTANPKDEELESVSHDPNHFVWVKIKDALHSFVIPQLLAFCYPLHTRSQFVFLLMKPSHLRELKLLQKQIAERNLH